MVEPPPVSSSAEQSHRQGWRILLSMSRARLNPFHYSATRFQLQIWQFAKVQRLFSTHYCLGIICLFIAHNSHFLDFFSKVVLGTVDIIITHSTHIEKSPVLVSFLQTEG